MVGHNRWSEVRRSTPEELKRLRRRVREELELADVAAPYLDELRRMVGALRLDLELAARRRERIAVRDCR